MPEATAQELEIICGVCEQPIKEDTVRVAYEKDSGGINPLDPKTWVPLHNDPSAKTLCTAIYDADFDMRVGYFVLTREEYREALEHGKIPERYQKTIQQFRDHPEWLDRS